MRFCDSCGSFMRETARGFRCSRCGKLIRSEPRVANVRESPKRKGSSDIYVVEKPQNHSAKVNQLCPKCGNQEAFHQVSSISGEHAGIRRERTIEHFKCAKCLHTWTKAS